jgi:poly-gamma-glutamate synthase PgsB/CapB
MVVILSALLLLLSLAILEACLHERRLRRIPIRIHVNGTRGKSTTTRLIAAGLRAGGLRVIAKTTGTLPRIILEDGSEVPVRRRGRATIREQMRVIALAARRRADAVVLECMAVHPELQWVSERRMVRATVGVMTNVRLDHMEVMGQTRETIAGALSLTVPRRGILVTGSREHLDLFAEACARHGSVLRVVPDPAESGPVAGGAVLDFPENTATALAVCDAVGIDRERALRGMREAVPDVGALRVHRTRLGGKPLTFLNAFSINDVDSLRSVWTRLEQAGGLPRPLIAILNCRADRPLRSTVFGEVAATLLRADWLVLVGEATRHASRTAVGAGFDPGRILRCQGRLPEETYRQVVAQAVGGATVIGIGNYYGAGEAIAALFVGSPDVR